jgi:endogenous inhibitor of DNA gyrase (YacG/DUF329 family)
LKDLRKQVAFVRGLMTGSDLDTNDKSIRVVSEVVNVLEDIADSVMKLHECQVDLEDYVEDLDRDLWDVEETLNSNEGREFPNENDMEVECPTCHEIVCFDSDILDGDDDVEVTCPNCNAIVFVSDNAEYEAGKREGKGKKLAQENIAVEEDL